VQSVLLTLLFFLQLSHSLLHSASLEIYTPSIDRLDQPHSLKQTLTTTTAMSFQRLGFAAFALFIGAKAIDSITAPNVVAASTPFTLQVTPKDGASGSYRILLDTTPPGFNGGQSCTLLILLHRQISSRWQMIGYLKNSTSSDITTVNLTIPADFGPNGDFYSISVRDLSDMDTKSNYVFSNAFNLTGATGVYTEYVFPHITPLPLCLGTWWPADLTPRIQHPLRDEKNTVLDTTLRCHLFRHSPDVHNSLERPANQSKKDMKTN
jgi:hypothetical protein